MLSKIPERNAFALSSFEQVEKLSEKIAMSTLCPDTFRGKPGDVFVAIMFGQEIGLSPMNALQNIYVVKGRPTLFGDALLGLVITHPDYISHKEWIEGTGDNRKYLCTICRKGQEPVTKSFSVEDAKLAKLWGGKSESWEKYPERMLQMRARTFCIRDTFPDALKGITSYEEAQDSYSVVEATYEQVEKEKEKIGTPLSVSNTIDSLTVHAYLSTIYNSQNVDELKQAYEHAMRYLVSDINAINKTIEAKNKRYHEINKIIFEKASKESQENEDLGEGNV